MNNLLKILFFILSFLMVGCNIDIADKTKTIQISETIEESKANKVFIAEYESNMDIIEKSWTEEPWLYDTEGNIKKKGGNQLYIVAKDNIGLSRTSDRCNNGDTSNGNIKKKEHYITMRLSEEELSNDSLVYYVFEGKEKKCLGELILKKSKYFFLLNFHQSFCY